MPTRFPTGLNMLPGDHSLKELPFPVLNSQWGILFDDFTVPNGVADSSVTWNGWSYVSLTAAGAVVLGTSGTTNIANQMGAALISTGAAATAATNLYIGNGQPEEVIGNLVLGTPTNGVARDWIISARLSQTIVTTSGFAFGAVDAGSLNNAGVTSDLCTAATTPVSGALIRKASGATDVIMDVYSASAKIITTTTVVANASLAVSTMNRYTMHYRARANKLDAYFNDKRVASVTPTAAIPVGQLGAFMGARADGSNATTRSVVFDYLLAAVKVGAR